MLKTVVRDMNASAFSNGDGGGTLADERRLFLLSDLPIYLNVAGCQCQQITISQTERRKFCGS